MAVFAPTCLGHSCCNDAGPRRLFVGPVCLWVCTLFTGQFAALTFTLVNVLCTRGAILGFDKPAFSTTNYRFNKTANKVCYPFFRMEEANVSHPIYPTTPDPIDPI